MKLLICITHCQRWDSKDKLRRTLASLHDVDAPIMVVDDSGEEFIDEDYYDEFFELDYVVFNKENLNSFLARREGAIEAKNLGFDLIQYIDTGDLLVIDRSYWELVDKVATKNYDMGIYPQTSIGNGVDPEEVYFSRIGTTHNQARIQQSLLERSLSCSQCMKIYKVDLVLKAYDYPELKDLHVFDLDDYAFNLMYALHCKSLTSSLQPHYIYYLEGNSNTTISEEEVTKKYEFTKSWLVPLIKKYYAHVPEPLLDHYLSERLTTYFNRQTNGYNWTW